MKASTGARARKVAVSIPAYLYAWGEEERARRALNRSEFVADLYERYQQEMEREQRTVRYAVAYAAVPELPEERALTEASMQLLGTEFAGSSPR